MNFLTYRKLEEELDKFFPILQDILLVLKNYHLKSPIPASEEGLWIHHEGKNGLFLHSIEVGEIAYSSLGIKDFRLYTLLQIIGLAHDFSKIFGKKDTDHSFYSSSLFEAEILSSLKNKFPPFYIKDFLHSDLYRIIFFSIRYHNFIFKELIPDNNFVSFGKNLFDPKFFPWILLILSSDFLSITKYWINK